MTKYQKAIEWIALNDEPNMVDMEEINGLISVELAAFIFDKTNYDISEDVIKFRKKHIKDYEERFDNYDCEHEDFL